MECGPIFGLATGDSSGRSGPARAVKLRIRVRRLIPALALAVVVAGGIVASTNVYPSAASTNHAASGCAASPATYRNALPTDCVAPAGHDVAIDHTYVSASWSLAKDRFGFTNVCARVTIRNYGTARYSYNDIYWTMQAPKGSPMVLNFTAKDPLGAGFLAHGGMAHGNICFDYSGAAGQYVGLYAPIPLNPTRAVWVFSIP